MTFLLLLSLLAGAITVECQTGLLNGRIDAVTNLISISGYATETHRVQTDDGYLLKLHRMTPRVAKEKLGPVLLIHGLFGTAGDFLITGPPVALAYQLANDGFDVWMGNVRGSKFSMKHVNLDPTTRNFWSFSFHEIGVFDLPAMIDYILEMTGFPSLFYVGHNQAAAALLALLAVRPEYNAKILQAYLLAPLVFMDYPHPMLYAGIENRLRASPYLPTFNFPSMIDLTNLIKSTYCNDGSPAALLFCADIWFFAFGKNPAGMEMNPSLLLDIPNFVSPTASTRQWDHFLQISRSGTFQSFDSSDSLNQGRQVPFAFNLVNVRVPIYLYHGAEDLVVSRLDVEHLKVALGGSVAEYRIIPNWNHMDFIVSKYAKATLYDSLVAKMSTQPFDFMKFVQKTFG